MDQMQLKNTFTYTKTMSKTAFPHQVEGIEFLKTHKRVILADEMGLGKTFQAITAAGDATLQNKLVLCPASLKLNWKREIESIYPEDIIHVVESGKEQTIPETATWIIINYDMLTKYKAQLIKLRELGLIDTAICDEAHYIKGKKTIRAKVTLEIIEGLEYVFMLTGTPLMNRPAELFNLLKGIGHPLGRARTTFTRRYCDAKLVTQPIRGGRVIRFWDESGAEHLDELREFTKEAILRRTKQEVLDLPPKISSVQITELPKEYKVKYMTTFDDYIDFLRSNPVVSNDDVNNALTAKHLIELIKLKQLCSEAKLPRIVEDIRSAVSQGEKVIVFSQFTNTINKLQEMLLEKKRASQHGDAQDPIKSVVLTGASSMSQRQAAVDSFQNDEDTKVFIGNIKAAGVGITLTRASIVMFADMEWSPALHDQAEDRAHRIGQEGTVNIYYYVIQDTVEEDIVDLLQKKKSVIKDVVEGSPAERWSKQMERINTSDLDEESKEVEYVALEDEMKDYQANQTSMAAEFLDRMKKKMGISR